MQGDAPGIRLVVGLGNPGAEYDRTRHNVGFAVLDQLAAESRVGWERSAKWGAYWTKAGNVFLLKPMAYMNRSGGPTTAFAQFYKLEPAETLVVLDDMALELGRLRIRFEGSSGGHNGLESIITTFGTENIPRLRFGIGAALGSAAVDYVLGRFFEEERPIVEKAVNRAVEAVNCAIDKGVLSAMNTFNKIPEA